MNNNALGSGETKLETVISYLLVGGVIISLLLEIAGMVLFYNTFRNLQVSHDLSVFVRGNNFFIFLTDEISGRYGDSLPLRLMSLGTIALLITPYLRVIASAIYFGWVKNVKYVFITLFVAAVLTASLIWRYFKY